MRRPLFSYILRLALVLCSLVTWGVVIPGTQALAAEGGGESASTSPTIESESQSSITEHGVTLEAQINSEGSETEYQLWLECGVENFQCGSAERVGSGYLPASDSGQAVSAVLSDLEHGDAYKYWVVATNSEGTTKGAVRIFAPSETWPGPVSETGAASNVSQMSATLEGQIYPEGRGEREFTYFFEYGTSTSYGTSAPTPQGKIGPFATCGPICEGEQTNPKPASVDLTGLASGTIYHYRLVSTNADGYRSFGEDVTFTTSLSGAEPSGSEEAPPSITELGGSSLTLGGTPLVSPLVKTVEPKALARDQKLSRALKACEKKAKKKHRAVCRSRLRRSALRRPSSGLPR